MPLKTYPFDPAEHLSDPEGQVELLQEAFELGHTGFILNSISTVARARRFSANRRIAGTKGEAPQTAPLPKEEATLAMLLEVTEALGHRLALVPIEKKS